MADPGTTQYYNTPIAQRKLEYDRARWMTGATPVAMEAYFTPSEVAYFQAQKLQNLQPWQEEVKKKYPAFASYLEDPDVSSILHDAMNEHWPIDILQAHLEASVWWKSHSPQQRQWFLLNTTDPAGALQSVQGQYLAIHDKAKLFGLNLTSGQMMALSTQALSQGWTDQQLTENMIKTMQGHADHGTLGVARDQLKGIANDYLMPASDKTLDDWSRRVVSGTANLDVWKDQMSRQAQSRYQDPGIKDALQRGMTVKEFADPYVQQAAQTLGVNPNEIDLLNNKWNQALDHVDPKTGQRRAMSMNEWDQHIKLNPIYGYDHSENGLANAAQLVGQIREKFGVQ